MVSLFDHRVRYNVSNVRDIEVKIGIFKKERRSIADYHMWCDKVTCSWNKRPKGITLLDALNLKAEHEGEKKHQERRQDEQGGGGTTGSGESDAIPEHRHSCPKLDGGIVRCRKKKLPCKQEHRCPYCGTICGEGWA